MSKAYNQVISALRSQVWAIDPNKLEAIVAFLALKAEGKDADAGVLAQIHGASELQAARAQKVQQAGKGAVAVLPVYGLILHRGSSMGDISGPAATSTVKLLQQFRQAAEDPSVSAIVFDIDSPGGTVEGVDELASEIRACAKQTIAVSNKLCASAAYYIASACKEIVVSPSSTTGSIGVYCHHEDISKLLDNEGIKISMIKFGENKAEGNPYEPLTDNARGHMQDMVDMFGNMFEKAVAKGRKVSQAKVHETFGQGLMFGATQAVKIGMADSVGTFDSVLARFGVTVSSPSTSMAAPDSRTAKLEARTTPAADDSAECECDCGPCEDGDCAGCTHKDCDCDGCGCDAAMSGRATGKAESDALRLKLQIASA